MTIDLKTVTIAQAHTHLVAGDVTAVELAETYLANIEKKNEELNAYLEVFDDVLEQAKAADSKLKNLERAKRAELPNLFGVPLAIKDNILIEGRHVSAASKILEGYVASYDATAIKKLKDAGAVFLGRTNCDEFAMGSSTENSAYGVTKNPHDTLRVPGGSSGGSAVAVAANLALAALGSDTAGSVRQPAAFCGAVGFKPTYGAVSRSGLIAMGSSLDVIGPIAKTVEDAQTVFEAIAGKDPLDSTSIGLEARPSPTSSDGLGNPKHLPDFAWAKSRRAGEIRNVRIGIPKGFIGKGVDEDVLKNFSDSLKRFEDTGAEVREIELSLLPYSLPAYYTIIPAEISANLARFDGVKYGAHESGGSLQEDYFKTRARFGPEVRRRILLGTYVLSAGYADAYYRRAVAVRSLVRKEIASAFSGKDAVDVIMTPTTPTPAFKIGEKSADPVSMYLADIFTVIANIAGIPALSIPSGFVKREGKRLPLGLQLMAAHGREDTLFAAGKLFEQSGAAS